MIGFIDSRPVVEPYNGLFRLTLGDQQFVLTLHALHALHHQCRITEAAAVVAGREEAGKLIPFSKGKRKEA